MKITKCLLVVSAMAMFLVFIGCFGGEDIVGVCVCKIMAMVLNLLKTGKSADFGITENLLHIITTINLKERK